MTLVFRENAKTRQNNRSFEVAVMGGNNSQKIYFYLSGTSSDFYSGDPPGYSFSYDFSGKDIKRKKISAIGNTKN